MILLLLITTHFLADFTLQSPNMAQRKRGSGKFLLLHGCVYAAAVGGALFLTVAPEAALLPGLVIGMSHLLIDAVRIKLDKHWRSPAFCFFSFLADQALHLGIILACGDLFSLRDHTNCVYDALRGVEGLRELAVYAAAAVTVWDPACIFIKMLFHYYGEAADAEPEATVSNPNAGALIGKLERVLIAVLVLTGNPGSIAFVLTAKSLARHKQLEDINFAEKYLVGTLASAAFALVVAMTLKGLYL